MADDFLTPWVDDDSEPFWAATAKGELRMQACASCRRLRFPPRPMCPWCRSLECEWPLMSGRGTVWSFVIAHPPLLPAYAALAPYNVVVVSLDEDPGIRVVGNLVSGPDGGFGAEDVPPESITIGTPVEAVFQHLADEFVLPRWVTR